MAHTAKARVCVLRGQLHEASSLSAVSLARARTVEDPQVLATALAVAVMIERERGNSAAVAELAAEFARVVPPVSLEGGCPLPEVVRLCAAVGALDVADRLIDGRSDALLRHRIGVLTARAIVAEAKGSLEDAARLYDDASREWAEYGYVLEHAHALHGLGRCRAALGDEDPQGSATAAADLFARLGVRTVSTDMRTTSDVTRAP